MDMLKEKGFLSLLSTVCVSVFIGLPIWWKTTEVYRSPLPYTEINELKNQPISPSITACTVEFINLLEEELDLSLLSHNVTVYNSVQLTASLSASSTTPTERQEMLNQLQSNPNMDMGQSIGRYTVYIVPKGTLNQSVYYSNKRHVIIEETSEQERVLNELCGFERILSLLANSTTISQDKQQQQSPQMQSLRRARISPGYDINIILINSDPLAITAHWNIEETTNNLLLLFLQDKDVSKVAKFTVSSQILYYTDIELRTEYNSDYSSYSVSSNQLPSMISNIEAKLGSRVSQWPGLNFVIFIPKKKEIPLYITEGETDERVDSFLVPQWGGVLIYNPSNTSVVQVSMENIMPTIIRQLKLLLGLPDKINNCHISSYCLSQWDIDHLLIVQTIERLHLAKLSLVSLVELLDDVKNMVINDHIQHEVSESLEQINMCIAGIVNMQWETAHKAALSALYHADVAFFDPSILALLYFPDDQKYAIYIPLFLPISLPVILTLVKYIKSWRGGTVKEKTL